MPKTPGASCEVLPFPPHLQPCLMPHCMHLLHASLPSIVSATTYEPLAPLAPLRACEHARSECETERPVRTVRRSN